MAVFKNRYLELHVHTILLSPKLIVRNWKYVI